jgi:outer membrane protein OmpA-like peptidoglycan-associated protein
MKQAMIHAVLGACTLALLAGCATPPPPEKHVSYVTLLASPDGSVGKVLVSGPGGEQLIDKAQYAALLDGSSPAQPVDLAKFQNDCGDAVAARPLLPEHFYLYFESGGTQLTAASLALIPQILQEPKERPTADMSIIGHSDTVGKAELNEALSLKRAQSVAELLKSQGLKVDALSVESHGKRNLLVPTPDETPEPRNRRVEITIR